MHSPQCSEMQRSSILEVEVEQSNPGSPEVSSFGCANSAPRQRDVPTFITFHHENQTVYKLETSTGGTTNIHNFESGELSDWLS